MKPSLKDFADLLVRSWNREEVPWEDYFEGNEEVDTGALADLLIADGRAGHWVTDKVPKPDGTYVVTRSPNSYEVVEVERTFPLHSWQFIDLASAVKKVLDLIVPGIVAEAGLRHYWKEKEREWEKIRPKRVESFEDLVHFLRASGGYRGTPTDWAKLVDSPTWLDLDRTMAVIDRNNQYERFVNGEWMQNPGPFLLRDEEKGGFEVFRSLQGKKSQRQHFMNLADAVRAKIAMVFEDISKSLSRETKE